MISIWENNLIPEFIIGWDVGGAHVKVAVLHGSNLIDVTQYPCPIWRGLSFLGEVADRVLDQVPAHRVCHAVTMTGELADLFSGRDEGVRQILKVFESRINPGALYVFAGTLGLIESGSLNSDDYPRIASANWLACAVYLSDMVDAALFVDIGSTTTDVLLLEAGKVRARGFSDYERLISGEMVYRGIVRTPIAALAKRVLFDGRNVPLMAEFFATTADVYRLTGELPEDYDQWPAADGAEKTQVASARRLARMIGRDLESGSLNPWIQLAGSLREYQLREIQDALIQQISRMESDRPPQLVGAGIGRFLAIDVAARIGVEYRDFSSIVDHDAALPGIAECAPAVSLALLMAKRLPG